MRCPSHPSCPMAHLPPQEPMTVAYMADDPTPVGCTTSELYNSGVTRHMTPYWMALTNYATIPPMPINAANQHTFHAIRQGDLPICMPNGSGSTKITLKDVLHNLDIALMLVSISLIYQAGYTVTFEDGTCIICNLMYKLVCHFPKRDGLYKVDTQHPECASICSTDPSISITNAHCHLSHISLDSVWQLCQD